MELANKVHFVTCLFWDGSGCGRLSGLFDIKKQIEVKFNNFLVARLI